MFSNPTVSSRLWLAGSSAIALAAVSGPAYAQDETDAAQPAAQSGSAPIIVTAQRREQELQDVPISLVVVQGEEMREQGLDSFEELAPTIPSLTVAKTPGAHLISMRGIGSGPGSPSLEQSVVTFVDGIYGGSSRQFAAPFMDVQRVEVLRGPQGALVGKNTSAGAINIITTRPGDEFGGYVNASYNLTDGGPSVTGAVDIPVSSNVAFRVAGTYSDVDGYIYNTLTDREEPGRREIIGRISMLAESGPVTLFAKYEHADVNGDGVPVQVRSVAAGLPFDYEKESRLLFSEEFDNLTTNNAVIEASVDLGGFTLVSISGYSGFTNRTREDADFYFADLATADFDIQYDQLSQEVRLLSPAGETVEFAIGGLYQVADLFEERTTGILFAPPASTYRIFDQQSELYSFYGQATVNITDAFRAVGSLRYTHETKDAAYTRFQGPLTYLPQREGATVAAFSDSLSEGLWDPGASLQYDVTDDIMVYASFNRGSKGGGFQGAISNAVPFSFEFAPERSESFEVGSHMSFRGRGFLNIAAYHTQYQNLQVSVALPSPDGLSAPFFTGNAGDATTYGIELDGAYRFSPNFSISGNLAWVPEANYEEYTAGPCYTGQVPDGSQPGSCDLTDARLIYSPELSGSLTGEFSHEIGGSLLFSSSVTGRFQTESVQDFTEDPLAVQDGFVKLDARIAIGDIDDRWEVALVGRNLTDHETIAFAGSGGISATFLSPDARLHVIDPPRTILVQGSFRF